VGFGEANDAESRASNSDLETLLAALRHLRDGDFNTRLSTSGDAVFSEIATTFNEIAERDQRLERELSDTRDPELTARAEELEQALGSRNRFYASMSHVLRTPINAVVGYSNLLLDGIYGPLNEKQREGIQRTLRAARHLLELVNDVLDLSKIEAGKIELRLQRVSVPALLDDLFVTVRPLADERGSILNCEVTGNTPMIDTDPRRVRQILLNLLSNAIKFGQQQPIMVHCEPNDMRGVTIEVIDRGEGIAANDIHRIFEEFVQVGAGPRKQPGTGLGLPISRRLAELLEGGLEVESAPGRGSTFRLKLPQQVRAGQGVPREPQVVSAA
jgi:signal transduction histidine kinase